MAGVRCLQRKLDKLARSIHPVTVSTALLAEEIIEQRAWEEARREGLPHYDRSLNLLETVMRCVGTRPSVYEQFCKILEQETVTEGLAAELRESLVCQNKRKGADSPTKEQRLERNNIVAEEDSNVSRKRCRNSDIDGPASAETKEGRISGDSDGPASAGAKQGRISGDSDGPASAGAKEGRISGDSDGPASAGAKKGRISGDKSLMDVAWEVGEKWEELGVVLGLEYKVLQSVVGSQVGKPDHLKAFYMLCEWRRRSAFRATYAALADALEESGLNSCAEEHCYDREP